MKPLIISLFNPGGMAGFLITTKVSINVSNSLIAGRYTNDMRKGVKTWEVTTWENSNLINI